MDTPIPLEFLLPGQAAVVEEVVGLAEDVVRLEELGLSAGRAVEMVQPGSPCIIKLNGHKLCLRAADSFGILVRPGAPL